MDTAPGDEATKWTGELTVAPAVGADTTTSAKEKSEDKNKNTTAKNVFFNTNSFSMVR